MIWIPRRASGGGCWRSGKPYPYARHSCSYHPAPMHISTRPPGTMSTAAATLGHIRRVPVRHARASLAEPDPSGRRGEAAISVQAS